MPAVKRAIEGAAAAIPRREAEALLLRQLGRERAFLYAHPEHELSDTEAEAFAALVRRRASGEPMQYLTGEQEFLGRVFHLTPAVLIPRPETELVAAAAIEKLPPRGYAIDVGTGSGCLAVSLALAHPDARIVAVDLLPAALTVAAANAARLGATADFAVGDLLDTQPGGFDLIVSNPPYVAEDEFDGLPREVRDFEPRQALVAGPTGLEIYERLAAQAATRLQPGGWLVLELGYESAPGVRAMLKGWSHIETRPDAQGWERVLLAQR